MGVGESARAMLAADAAVLAVCPLQDADRTNRSITVSSSGSFRQIDLGQGKEHWQDFPSEHRQRMQDNDGSSG